MRAADRILTRYFPRMLRPLIGNIGYVTAGVQDGSTVLGCICLISARDSRRKARARLFYPQLILPHAPSRLASALSRD